MQSARLHLGQIVTEHSNPLMVVGSAYRGVVARLADSDWDDPSRMLLACLVASQTEAQYKNYMLLALLGLTGLPADAASLVDAWQDNRLAVPEDRFEPLFTPAEWELLRGRSIESHLDDHPELFDDGLSTVFYPTMKKGMALWRRLSVEHATGYDRLDDLQRLVLHFTTAQLLVSWESSCVDLGLMLLDGWDVQHMSDRYALVWPIHTA